MNNICLCSSRKFFDKIEKIKEELEKLGYNVLLPSMINIQDDFYSKGGSEAEFAKIHYNLIKKHFQKIEDSDAIFICNFEKDGIEGYIGGNTFMEMAKAFDSNKPIFLLYPIPKMHYRAEIIAMQPIIINKLNEIKEFLK